MCGLDCGVDGGGGGSNCFCFGLVMSKQSSGNPGKSEVIPPQPAELETLLFTGGICWALGERRNSEKPVEKLAGWLRGKEAYVIGTKGANFSSRRSAMAGERIANEKILSGCPNTFSESRFLRLFLFFRICRDWVCYGMVWRNLFSGVGRNLVACRSRSSV